MCKYNMYSNNWIIGKRKREDEVSNVSRGRGNEKVPFLGAPRGPFRG